MYSDYAPLADRLHALAEQFLRVAWERDPQRGDAFLLDHAASLSEFAHHLDTEYVRLGDDAEFPTNAQGVALARFLRGCFREPERGPAHAFVCRGGSGLPDDYVHVRMHDGYEAGIAPDGAVST